MIARRGEMIADDSTSRGNDSTAWGMIVYISWYYTIMQGIPRGRDRALTATPSRVGNTAQVVVVGVSLPPVAGAVASSSSPSTSARGGGSSILAVGEQAISLAATKVAHHHQRRQHHLGTCQ